MTIEELDVKLERLIFGLHNELSAFRVEVIRRFEDMESRDAIQDRRLDRLADDMHAISRAMENAERRATQEIGTRAGERRYTESLARRVARIEDKLGMTGEAQ
jgi:hypothetical protein